MFCPTLSSVTKTLTESFLGRPSHPIIHVGTNDIERSSLDSCLTQFETMVEIASQKYPSSKVLISSLLKRRDATDQRRSDLNSKLGTVCAPYPNVHLVNNENIPEDYLHDNKHLKRRKIGALVTNLKDVKHWINRQTDSPTYAIPSYDLSEFSWPKTSHDQCKSSSPPSQLPVTSTYSPIHCSISNTTITSTTTTSNTISTTTVLC